MHRETSAYFGWEVRRGVRWVSSFKFSCCSQKINGVLSQAHSIITLTIPISILPTSPKINKTSNFQILDIYLEVFLHVRRIMIQDKYASDWIHQFIKAEKL